MMADPTLSRHGREPKVRRFYKMDIDLRLRSRAGYKLENEKALLQGKLLLAPPVGQRGFPHLCERPQFVFDKKIGHLPLDLEQCHSYWLVSDRMKSVLEAADPQGVAFLSCDVRLSNGEVGPDYWLCDVLRVLDAVDEEASRVQIRLLPQYSSKTYQLAGGADLVFREDVIGAAHIFRLKYLEPVIFCDQQLKEACKVADLKGVSFKEFKGKV